LGSSESWLAAETSASLNRLPALHSNESELLFERLAFLLPYWQVLRIVDGADRLICARLAGQRLMQPLLRLNGGQTPSIAQGVSCGSELERINF
jgi:hypothetical protein